MDLTTAVDHDTPAATDRRAERRLVVATGLAAAVPVLGTTLRALATGWVPMSDPGIAAARAYDVFTSWTPLVGQWSSGATDTVGQVVYSPGPLLFWLLALPARLPGSAGFVLTMGAVYTAAVMGTVALADRRGGRALMLMTALALALMCRSLETRTLNDIWNSAAAVMLVPLLIFMCWSLACGDYRLLPATILVASFIAQCHLILVLPALCAVGVGVAGLAHWRWRRPSAPAGRMRWWVAAGVAVAVVCWSAPVVDQALAWTGSDRGIGNLQLLAEAALHRDRPVGTAGGGRAVAQAIGVPPWWLRAPQPPDQRTFAIFRSIPPLRLATTLLVLGALVAAAVAGVKRRRADVVWAAVLALALCAALAATTASFPNTPRNIFSYSYSSWWAMPAGMWAWLVVGWAVLALAPVRRLRRPSVARWPRVAAVAGVTATGVLVVALQHDYALRPEFQPTRTVLDRLEAALPDPGTVRVESSTFPFTSAVIQGLRRRGATIETSIIEFGPDYTRKDPPADHVVDIRAGAAPAPGAKVVARARATPKAPLTTVSLRAVR